MMYGLLAAVHFVFSSGKLDWVIGLWVFGSNRGVSLPVERKFVDSKGVV